jgi:hypothetical protein
MTKALVIHNSKCLKCGAVNPCMIKVGYMVFCDPCFDIEFIESGLYYAEKDFEIDPTSDVYKKWLEVYKDFISKVD